MALVITKFWFHDMKSLYVAGSVESRVKKQIKKIRAGMAEGEYAGWAPKTQKDYRKIKRLLRSRGYRFARVLSIP